MQRSLFFLLLFLFPANVFARPPGEAGFLALKHCIMQNDTGFCRSILTPGSYDIFDRFVSYKLMPCLPTDFSYVEESPEADHIMVKAAMPAGGDKQYNIRLMFTPAPQGLLLDIPASFQRGLGDDWQNKIAMSEQIYLMMRQNMGDRLNCDMLNGLIKPH